MTVETAKKKPGKRMPLITCPDCNKAFSERAPVCPHCGGPAVIPSTEKNETGVNWRAAVLVVIVVSVGLFFLVVLSEGTKSKAPSSYVPAPNASPPRVNEVADALIEASVRRIRITNTSSQNWPEMTVYLNGVMTGYKYKGGALARGEKVEIELMQFVSRGGDRFKPEEKAIKEVVVGVPGMDSLVQSFR